MDLIYYYPVYDGQAPSKVSKILLEYLIKNREKIPFTLKVLAPTTEINNLHKFVDGTSILTSKDLKSLSPRENVIHIPKSPWIAFNNRFRVFLWALHKNIPIISNYHGDFRVETKIPLKNDNPLKFFSYTPSYILAPYLLRSSDWLIVNSFWMSKLLREDYSLENNIRVIPNGIEDWWFQKGDEITLEGDPTFFYHGRLSYEKGVHLLIEAFSSIKTSSKNNAKLYIAGKGPLDNKLKSKSIKLGMKKEIIFLGHVPLSELKRHLQNSDAIIYPSLYEPFSIAVLEALSTARAPVFISNRVGLLSFMDQNSKKHSQTFNPNIIELTNIINNVIHGKYDKKVHNIQSNFAKKFLWKNIIPEYLEFYQDVYNSIKSRLRIPIVR